MGIKGLLKSLQGVQRQCHISEYRGCVVGIDGYAWLHRAAFTDLNDSVFNAKSTEKPILYCLKRASLLIANGIKPFFIFDGKNLPSKAATNAARREARKNAKEQAEEILRTGGSKVEAYKLLGQAISITQDMVVHLIKRLSQDNIQYLVAPYEADAQLGFLSYTNQIQAVISEDSDLLLYGCKLVLFKLDETGRCYSIAYNDLPKAQLLPNFSEDALIVLCCLAGCDYIDSVKGIGLKKGAKFVASAFGKFFGDPDDEPTSPTQRLQFLSLELKAAGYSITDDYPRDLKRALYTFKHQTVFDPIKQCFTRRYTLPDKEDVASLNYLGPTDIDPATAADVCFGRRNPYTLELIDTSLLPTSTSTSESKSTLNWINSATAKESTTKKPKARSHLVQIAGQKRLMLRKVSTEKAQSVTLSVDNLEEKENAKKPNLPKTGETPEIADGHKNLNTSHHSQRNKRKAAIALTPPPHSQLDSTRKRAAGQKSLTADIMKALDAFRNCD